MEIEKLLDEYLDFLMKGNGIVLINDGFGKTIQDLIAELKINQSDFDELTEILFLDGYVDRNFSNDGITINRVAIKLKGKMFSNNGGYVLRRKDTIRARVLQSLQTWAIAAGTVCLFLIELIKWIVERCDMIFCNCK